MDHFNRLNVILVLFFLIFSASLAQAQQKKSYEIIPAPDLWYNDVDGIRVGVQLKGQVPGTFEDGPHRIDAGVWLGTWIPSDPVSYYFNYTQPIESISDFGSEGNVQVTTLFRAGFHRHGVSFTKRWQQGFNEQNYVETGISYHLEKRFNLEYAQYPILWSDDWNGILSPFFSYQNENGLGRINLDFKGSIQTLDNPFTSAVIAASQTIPLGEILGFKVRFYAGASSNSADPEYLFSRSSSRQIEWMDSGFTRAKGTIPMSFLNGGKFNVAGGANLRGYSGSDFQSFEREEPFLINSIGALNTEFDYPSPLGRMFNNIPFLGEFLSFRSYMFFDAGTPLGITENEIDNTFADGGGGFAISFNVPDSSGKPRGFVFRYEIPFWLSDPGAEQSFRYRSLFGFGAVIAF